jgi:3-phenylpropionate/cinnamic acid dioxygenase small subunit
MAEDDERMITLEEGLPFVWREAELLDRLAYAEWLDLWTADGLYIVPIDRGDGDPADALNIIYDGAEMRAARVKRLLSGFSMSAAPS